MSRYVPSRDEAHMIESLTLAGYAVVRQRTYDRLRERVALAERLAEWETERRDHTAKWAHEAFVEQRRLSDRLNEVCFAAAALGVSIGAINKALGVNQ